MCMHVHTCVHVYIEAKSLCQVSSSVASLCSFFESGFLSGLELTHHARLAAIKVFSYLCFPSAGATDCTWIFTGVLGMGTQVFLQVSSYSSFKPHQQQRYSKILASLPLVSGIWIWDPRNSMLRKQKASALLQARRKCLPQRDFKHLCWHPTGQGAKSLDNDMSVMGRTTPSKDTLVIHTPCCLLKLHVRTQKMAQGEGISGHLYLFSSEHGSIDRISSLCFSLLLVNFIGPLRKGG